MNQHLAQGAFLAVHNCVIASFMEVVPAICIIPIQILEKANNIM